MIPDPIQRTVKIPVKIVKGQVQFFYAGSLSEFVGDSIGDLVIPAHAIKNKEKLKALTSEKLVAAQPADTRLLVSLRLPTPRSPDKRKQEYLNHVSKTCGIPQFHGREVFADFIIRELLMIHLRGTKDATLDPCRCEIGFLDRDARSVNHVYTLLSTEFETQRISHTGNVFQKVYYRDEAGSWVPLDELRRKLEARQESEVFPE
jgi:hypothetical protein